MKALSDIRKDDVSAFQPIVYHLGGQWLLDPNEVNGWGILGVIDNVNSQDLGNVGATNYTRLAGGLTWPFPVRLKSFHAQHYVTNDNAHAWGWTFFKQKKQDGSNTVTTTPLFDEIANNGGTPPNDYGDTITRIKDLTFVNSPVIQPGEMFGMGVASPTANTTNYYVRILAGHLEFERTG